MYDARATSGETVPVWPADAVREATPRTEVLGDASADVLIVGAGIAGLSVAYHLLRAGRSVIVVDRGRIGAGETARSSAHLSSALDDRYTFLARAHGEQGARLAAESHRAAIDSIAEIVEREAIACGFERVDGYLFAEDERGVKTLQHELEAARKAGLTVELVERVPAAFACKAALRFADQAQFDPRTYLFGLADAVRKLGGAIHTERTIVEVEEKDGVRLTLEGGAALHARALVVATNSPIVDNLSLHTKQAPYRSYMLAIDVRPEDLGRGLFWDLADPYHYVRRLGEDVVLVGGEDHRVGDDEQPEHRFAALESWARARFPSAGAVRSRWSGQVLEPTDGLAFIGRSSTLAPPSSYVVTGDSGNGLTHGALAGLLITDLIIGRPNPWAELYDPSRIPVRDLTSLRTYATETTKVALSYTDWVVPAAAEDVALSPGEGCVVQHGLRKLAVAVDDAGVRHVCSAVCPHLGAVVRWNALEKSWDCPAHGSRFAVDGSPIAAPAQRGLAAPDGELTDRS